MAFNQLAFRAQTTQFIIVIINMVGGALNADFLTAVVYQTIYHEYENFYFYCSNYVSNQLIIAIRHLGGL